MKKMTDEQKAWLMSEGASRLRGFYNQQATLSVNALISAAMSSTDPNVKGHAMAYATWKAAISQLDLPKDNNGSD